MSLAAVVELSASLALLLAAVWLLLGVTQKSKHGERPKIDG